MIKLLNSGFARLKKDVLLLILIVFTIGLASIMIYFQYLDQQAYNRIIELDKLVLNNISIIGIVTAVFTALFVGREYSDGTLKNKIIIGSSRAKIYLSNLIIVITVSLILELLHLFIVFLIGTHIFGTLQMSLSKFLIIAVCIIGIIIANSSIFTCISMNIRNKTISAITSLLLAFGMMVTSILLISRLNEPKYIESAVLTKSNTSQYEIVQEKNPKYLNKSQRKVYENILAFIPTGQSFMILGAMDANFKIFPLYSLGVIILFTGLGIIIFKKQELK